MGRGEGVWVNVVCEDAHEFRWLTTNKDTNMNDQLQKALTDILAVLTEGAKVAGSAAVTQLPLLIREYLRWGLTDAAIWACMGVVFMLLGFSAIRWAMRTDFDYDDPREGIAWVFGIVGCLGGFVLLMRNSQVILHILVAPRTYLLDLVLEMAGR